MFKNLRSFVKKKSVAFITTAILSIVFLLVSDNIFAGDSKTDNPTISSANANAKQQNQANVNIKPLRSESSRAVLWDQPLSSVNTSAYVDQDMTDYPDYSSYLADDFTNTQTWTITSIYVPGDGWNAFSSLLNADDLHWAIYADAGGVPNGDPSNLPAPYWSAFAIPSDPQVAISVGTGGYQSNVLFTPNTPIVLPPGTWWLIFYPRMSFGSAGQWGRQPSDTTNGYTTQFINPGGGFGCGTSWQNWSVTGASQQDMAFRLEGSSGCTVLYDNGPLVTHPGGGPGGADVSRLQTSMSMGTLGFGHQLSSGNRVADDFTVSSPTGWQIDRIDFFAYQTGSTTTSTMSGYYVQIWNGSPDNPGSSVVWGDLVTNRMISTEWSNIYRDSESSPGGTTRPIMRSTCSIGVHLDPGTYWLEWMADGSSLYSGPWAPPITILGQTTTGNAIQYTGSWNPALDSGTSTQQGLPFVIYTCSGGGCPPITVSPSTLPDGAVGTPYSQTVSASGGTAPYTYSVTSGTLPTGLTLNSSTGVVSGTPSSSGTYNFTITATDASSCTGSQSYTVVISSGISSYLSFYDDYGRSRVCIDTATGQYEWVGLIPLKGVYPYYTGVASIMPELNGYRIKESGATTGINIYYDVLHQSAYGTYIKTGTNIKGMLTDVYVLDDPSCGGGGKKK